LGRGDLAAGSRPALIALATPALKRPSTMVQACSMNSGPEVSGPIMPLVMVMTGRKAALDDLTGDGVDTLRTRA
jgi:hypothetical protein